MALPRSGTITLRGIAEEFDENYSANTSYSLTDFYAGGPYVAAGTMSDPATGSDSAIPASGTISLTDFYGAERGIDISTRERTFYRRGSSAPSAPTASGFSAYTSVSGWSTTDPGATTTLAVYEVTLTQYFDHATTQTSSTFDRNEWSAVTLHEAVRPTPVTVTISASDTSPDAGESVTFTCNIRGGSGTRSYQWQRRQGTAAYANVGTNSSTYSMSDTDEEWDVRCWGRRGTPAAILSNVVTVTWADVGIAPWGAWSSWGPAVSSVCDGIAFTQSRSRSRTDNSETQNETRGATGTKPFGAYSAWTPAAPAASTICDGVVVTTNQTRSRTCISLGQTHTQTENRVVTTTGTKPFGAYSAWTPAAPAASTICDGVVVTTNQTRSRTCISLGQTHTQTENRVVTTTGTKPFGAYSAWTPAAPAASTICDGVVVTTNQTRSRTCISLGQTHTQTENRVVTTTGTQDCSDYPAPSLTLTLTEAGPQIIAEAVWTTSAGTRRNGQPASVTGIIGSASGDVVSFPPGTTAAAAGTFTADITEGVDYSNGDRIDQSVTIRAQFADGGESSSVTRSDFLIAQGGG